MVKEIPLTLGMNAIVDDEDYEFLMQWNWYAMQAGRGAYKKYYAARGSRKKNLRMHQALCPAPEGMETDHINGNSLDNRRCNLRICTHRQNIWNRKAVRGSASRYKGVDWYAASGNWRAYIKLDGKQKHLGCYKSEDDAARAYNKAALQYHGEFAHLNPVEGDPEPRITHPYQYKWHKSKQESYDQLS